MSGTTPLPPGIKPGYPPYLLGLLLVAQILNHLDRNLPAILLPAIKRDLELTDSQLGFITGLAFAVFYSVMGIPLGRLADHVSRRKVLAVCIGLWSLATAISGATVNFLQMAIARFAVGFGEAGLAPCAHSMVSDLYPPARRTTAFGVLAAGTPLGGVIAFVGGAWLVENFDWRIAFMVLGLPGLIVAALVWFTVKETPRGAADGFVDPGKPPPFLDVVKILFSIPAFRHCVLGTTFTGLVYTAVTIWAPSYLSRSFGMTAGEIGAWLSPAIGLGGVCGTLFGGWIADKVSAGDRRWMAWVPAITTPVGALLGTVAFITDNQTVAVVMIGAPLVLCPVHLPIYGAILQGLAGVRMRSSFPALSLFIAGIVGVGLGPQIVGWASDIARPWAAEESLRYGLMMVVPFFGLWAGIHFFFGGGHLPDDFAKAKARI